MGKMNCRRSCVPAARRPAFRVQSPRNNEASERQRLLFFFFFCLLCEASPRSQRTHSVPNRSRLQQRDGRQPIVRAPPMECSLPTELFSVVSNTNRQRTVVRDRPVGDGNSRATATSVANVRESFLIWYQRNLVDVVPRVVSIVTPNNRNSVKGNSLEVVYRIVRVFRV